MAILLLTLLPIRLAGADVPAYRELEFTLWSEGFDHHSEGGNLGEADAQPLEWSGTAFRLHYRPTKKPPLMRHESVITGEVSPDGRRLLRIEIDNTFWYEHLDGRDMVARTIVKARDLPLRPGRDPSRLVAEAAGPELGRSVYEVQWRHSHFGTRGLDYFQPKPTFRVDFARPPTATPVTVKGTVRAPDEFSWKPGADAYPLAGAAVELLKGDKAVARTTTDETGSYELQAPAGQAVALRVALTYDEAGVSRFRVVHDVDDEPAWMKTVPFTAKSPGKDAAGKDLPQVVDVSFAAAKGVVSDPRYATRLPDYAFAYASTVLAWRETKHLGLVMDFGLPLPIRLDSSQSVGAPVPMTNGEGPAAPCISLPREYSERSRRLREGVVWHEFGHYVMAGTFSHLYPHESASRFHGGYSNPTTNDSWGEGFASFFALLVSVDQKHVRRPVVSVNGWYYDFSVAWSMPWSQDGGVSQEEAAVAALLWDLVDTEENESVLEASNPSLDRQNVSFQSLLTDEKPPRRFRDRVAVPRRELLAMITGTAAAADAPPGAPSGYGHVFDVKQLHTALRAGGVGAARASGAPLDALDELFVGHGFFGDVAPPNLSWDEGEPVGLTANGAWIRTGPLELPARPERRYTPSIPNSYVAYEARTTSGEAVAVRRFDVEARYAPPLESHDYSFETWASEPGRLYVVCPNPTIGVSYRIRPRLSEDTLGPALDLDCSRYWKAKGKNPHDSFLTYTFVVDAPAVTGARSGGSVRLYAAVAVGIVAVGGAVLFLVGGLLMARRLASARAPAPQVAEPPEWWLEIADGRGGARAVTLPAGTLRLGRAPDNAVVFSDPEVSQRHAAIDLSPSGPSVRDAGSRNGTFVNDARIDGATALRAGDVVRIGRSWMRVRSGREG